MNGKEKNVITSLIKETERIEEDCMYSAKGHFNDADYWAIIHLWIGIPTAVLAALATASAFQNEGIIAGSISIVVTGLAALNTFLNPSDKAVYHKSAGTKYNILKNQLRIFRELDIFNNTDETELLKKLKEFSKERDSLNISAPTISRRAYLKAKKGITSGEASYRIDENKSK